MSAADGVRSGLYGGNPHDFPWAKGTLLQAPVSGTVKSVGWSTRADGSPSYGNLIVIVDQDGNEHYFAHLQGINKKLQAGDKIKLGTPLGKVGSSGNSTGPHLHYEIRSRGGYLDPTPFAERAQGGKRAIRYKDYSDGSVSQRGEGAGSDDGPGTPAAAANGNTAGVAAPAARQLGPNATDREILEYIGEALPGASEWLEIPALRKIILNTIRDNVDPNSFATILRSRIEASAWWTTRVDASRRADLLKQTDPTEYKAQVRAIANRLKPEVTEILGRQPDWDFLFAKAERIMRGDFDDATFLRTLTHRLAGVEGSNIREDAERDMGLLAGDYLLPGGNDGQWAQQILRGTKSEDDYKAYLREQAAGMFPQFAKMILAGATPRSLAQPYVSLLSQEMDRLYGADDPFVMAAMQQGATLSDFLTQVRSRPDWGRSTGAKDQALALADAIGKKFGAVA